MAEAVRRQPRVFRERRDVLNELNDLELIKRYRLNREGILFVSGLVREVISRPTARNKAISPELKVLATLRYLATGKMQQCSSDDLSPSQQTISRIIRETIYALSDVEILRRFLQFPLTQEATAPRQRAFLQDHGMPGIIGAIDGTHIRLTAPKEFEVEYVNRKGQHTINVGTSCHGSKLQVP